MDRDELVGYCLAKPGAEETYPWGEAELVATSYFGLSNEARAKLEAAQPRTVGQAGRLDGLTPAALGILAAYLRREARRKNSRATA